jgi:hypothetical protein
VGATSTSPHLARGALPVDRDPVREPDTRAFSVGGPVGAAASPRRRPSPLHRHEPATLYSTGTASWRREGPSCPSPVGRPPPASAEPARSRRRSPETLFILSRLGGAGAVQTP